MPDRSDSRLSRLPRTRKSRLALALGLLVLLGGGFAGGIAWATGGDPAGLYGDVHACYRNSGGEVRIVAARESCRSNESPIAWTQGYAQEVRRHSTPAVVSGYPDYTPIVSSSLLGSDLPTYYVVSAKTTLALKDSAVSDCRLRIDRNDVPVFTVDESSQGPSTMATHNLQAVVQLFGGGFNAYLQCRANAVWTAQESSIIGIKIGNPVNIVVTDADPVSP
jgi:hypothetical protein